MIIAQAQPDLYQFTGTDRQTQTDREEKGAHAHAHTIQDGALT